MYRVSVYRERHKEKEREREREREDARIHREETTEGERETNGADSRRERERESGSLCIFVWEQAVELETPLGLEEPQGPSLIPDSFSPPGSRFHSVCVSAGSDPEEAHGPVKHSQTLHWTRETLPIATCYMSLKKKKEEKQKP